MSPSNESIRLYVALRRAKGFITAIELMRRTGGRSTATRRTLNRWFREGLVKRKKFSFDYLWRWAPKPEARGLVARLADAARDFVGNRGRRAHDPAAVALRAVASLLVAAARKIESS